MRPDLEREVARPREWQNRRTVAHSPKSASRRDAIISAAITVINARGYELATMRDIAAALDLRDAALYYYFPSKQSLAYAAHVQSLHRFESNLHAAACAPADGAARLKAFLTGFIQDSYENGPQLYFGEHSYLDTQQRNEIDSWATRLTNVIEDMVSQGIADGSLKNCEVKLVVQLLLGMLIWLAKWVPSITNLTPERLIKAIDDVAFSGITRS